MTPTEFWKLKQDIKSGVYSYNNGEIVTVSHRKSTGYPRRLMDEALYVIDSIEGEFIRVHPQGEEKARSSWNTIKVHKYYIIPKALMRDRKIEAILKDEND